MKIKNQAYISVSVGFILNSIGILTSLSLLILLGSIIIIWGCYVYAPTKGYKEILGLILGFFFNLLGFIILFLLPNKKNKKIQEEKN